MIVLAGAGPIGTGMEETYQLTSALKFLPFGRDVALVTDARFSGVSTGACIGHVSPEALDDGPLGRVVDGDLISIVVDPDRLEATVELVGHGDERWTPEEAADVLASRPRHPDLAPDPGIPGDTRLWAALQRASGGLWGGCVYDEEAIVALLDAGRGGAGGRAARRSADRYAMRMAVRPTSTPRTRASAL